MTDRFIGFATIYGAHGEHETSYLTRAWIGRFRLHIFHRGDADPDCHDHPWPFWTFPLTSYVEEVAEWDPAQGTFRKRRQLVRAFRLHYRPATHCHRVLGRAAPHQGYTGTSGPDGRFELVPDVDGRRIVTIVWRGRGGRPWGFLKNRNGRWCWTHWREYVFGGGKHAPCEADSKQERTHV